MTRKTVKSYLSRDNMEISQIEQTPIDVRAHMYGSINSTPTKSSFKYIFRALFLSDAGATDNSLGSSI